MLGESSKLIRIPGKPTTSLLPPDPSHLHIHLRVGELDEQDESCYAHYTELGSFGGGVSSLAWSIKRNLKET